MAGMDTSSIPDEPELMEGVAVYLEAFYDLNTTRVNGMGVNAISWLNVRAYAEYKQFDEYQSYFLHKVVKALDPIFLEYANDPKKHKNRANT